MVNTEKIQKTCSLPDSNVLVNVSKHFENTEDSEVKPYY
jgi:hypothetical protein